MSAGPGRLVLLGHPVAHSLSPRMQNAALHAAGLPEIYEALDVLPPELPHTLRMLVAQRAGGNVTIPHKAAVAAACVRTTAIADRVGAVNTFWTEAGGLVGDNTDVAGFDALASRVLGAVPSGVCVALLGAGGGAAAVCAAVAEWPGARIRLFNRHPHRARELAARFPGLVRVATSAEGAVRDAEVVVNATPVGLRGDALPVEIQLLRRDAVVMDLAYRRGETTWVRSARASGHAAADGLEMLIGQGARAFERWFGFVPDVAAMRAAIGA